jgi:putative glutamine amidotransferase
MNKTQKKVIAIVGWNVGDNSFGVTKPYYDYLTQFGTVRIISPNEHTEIDRIITEVDAFVLPGGADVNPVRYNEVPHIWTWPPNQILESFDTYCLPKIVQSGKPIVGICRGMQTLAVYFGSPLTQHLYFHPQSKEREDVVHKNVTVQFPRRIGVFTKNSAYKGSKEGFDFNSLHHQSVSLENLTKNSPELLPMCTTDREKVVEMFIHESLPILGLQFHPEHLYDERIDEIINAIINQDLD